MGILVFSSLGSFITIKILHMPMSLNEILLVPFVFLLRYKFKQFTFNGSFGSIIGLVCILLVLALAAATFSAYAILSNARAWLYLFIGYVLFKNRNAITTDNLLYTSLGIIIAWALMALYNIMFVMPNMTYMEVNETAAEAEGVMIGVPIFFSLAFSKNNKLLILLGISLFIFISVFGGQRRIIVVGVVSIFASLFLSIKKNNGRVFTYLVILTVVIFVFIALLPMIEDFVNDISPMLHHRIFVRTRNLLEGGFNASNDDARTGNISLFINNFIEYTIPRGFVSLQTGIDKGTGLFNDLPIVELCWIFSWPAAFCIVGRYFSVLVKNYKCFVRYNHIESSLSVVCLLIMFVLLFLEGTYLNYPESSIITGSMLGRAVWNSKNAQLL